MLVVVVAGVDSDQIVHSAASSLGQLCQPHQAIMDLCSLESDRAFFSS